MLKVFPGFGDRSGAIGSDSHACQGQVEQFADIRLVVDDQYPGRAALCTPFPLVY